MRVSKEFKIALDKISNKNTTRVKVTKIIAQKINKERQKI